MNKAEYAEYLKSEHWQETRQRMLAFSGNRCQLCSSNGQTLNVHHNNYDRLGCEWVTDLCVLCRPCHERQHGKQQEAGADISLVTEGAAWECILGCLLSLRNPEGDGDAWSAVEWNGGFSLQRDMQTVSYYDKNLLEEIWSYGNKHRVVPDDSYLRDWVKESGDEEAHMERVKTTQALVNEKRHRHAYLSAALRFVTICQLARTRWAEDQWHIRGRS